MYRPIIVLQDDIIHSSHNSTVCQFADDCILYRPIADNRQVDLAKITEWEDRSLIGVYCQQMFFQ